MKELAARIIAALVLTACLAPVSAQERANGHALLVIDLRPKEEKSGTGLTPLSGPCNDGVYIIADGASKPPRMAALQADLARELGAAGNGKTLTVLDWTIYYSMQFYGDRAGEGAKIIGGNPWRGNRNSPGSKCSRQESTRGWFERSEVQGDFAPLVSVFEGTFGGSPVSVRVV